MHLILLVLVCYLLTGGIHLLSKKVGLITPRRLGRGKHPEPPTSEGGLAFLLGFLICLAYTYSSLEKDLFLTTDEMKSRHVGLGLALVWVWGLGRWGDTQRLPISSLSPTNQVLKHNPFSHRWSLVALSSGAMLLASTGFLIPSLSMGPASVDLGWLTLPVTILWLVAISEFVRLFEGLDGLLVGLVILGVCLQLFVVLPSDELTPGDEGYARALCFCALPPLLGLLPWRLYPAKVELRGIGAFLPGFVYGALTVVGREKAFTTKAVVIPLFVVIVVFSLFCLWILEQRVFLPRKAPSADPPVNHEEA